MRIASARNPVFKSADSQVIDLLVVFDGSSVEVPFTASNADSEAHGRDLFARAMAGEFGPVSPFVPKTQAELNAEANEVTIAALREIDIASIRSIREYIAGKPDALQILKNKDAAAAAERAKLK